MRHSHVINRFYLLYCQVFLLPFELCHPPKVRPCALLEDVSLQEGLQNTWSQRGKAGWGFFTHSGKFNWVWHCTNKIHSLIGHFLLYIRLCNQSHKYYYLIFVSVYFLLLSSYLFPKNQMKKTRHAQTFSVPRNYAKRYEFSAIQAFFQKFKWRKMWESIQKLKFYINLQLL